MWQSHREQDLAITVRDMSASACWLHRIAWRKRHGEWPCSSGNLNIHASYSEKARTPSGAFRAFANLGLLPKLIRELNQPKMVIRLLVEYGLDPPVSRPDLVHPHRRFLTNVLVHPDT